MYVIVAGGGKVGFYLAKALINEGHEVLVVEKDKRKADTIGEDLGSVVLRGDACEAATLSEAGTNRADVVVAVTGDDEDNLVICQMAKMKFNVPRTIARINNPKNEHVFRMLGIDSTVSSTDVIMSQIEQKLPSHALVHLRQLREANLELVEAIVSDQSTVIGVPLKNVTLPDETILLLIVRDSQTQIPNQATTLEAGDEVIALTRLENEGKLRSLLMA